MTAGDPFPLLPWDRPDADPLGDLRRAADGPAVDLLAEVEAMARRLAIGPLFLVHPDDVDRVLAKLRELEAELASDPLADVRASPFVERGTLLVITPEARATAHDAGLTDDLLADPPSPAHRAAAELITDTQEGTQ